jgi:hypothetical protein
VRGASALEDVVARFPNAPLRLLAVWERVLATDWATPGSGVLARLRDPRVAQFWDRGLLLSEHIRGHWPKSSGDRPDIVWDVVSIYPKGARWENGLPPALFSDGNVVDVMPAFEQALAGALAH